MTDIPHHYAHFLRRHGYRVPDTLADAHHRVRALLKSKFPYGWRYSFTLKQRTKEAHAELDRFDNAGVTLWTEADEARMDMIGLNGPTGEHYE